MMFNFGFNDFNIYTFTIKLGNAVIQNQTIQAPSMMAQQQFMQLTQQIANDDRPMQIKCTRIEFTEKDRELELFLTFENNAYVKAFREEDKD